MTVTQQDVLDTIMGLRKVASDLRSATEAPPVKGLPPGTVITQISGLLANATYLENVADELRHLIPDTPVKVPKR